ncbi:RNA polymerase II C-terminal domain phosphatase-like 1 isoform X2 [Punica granatum]|uniref:protein-serine/threonine phosphatase n=1 Tax=Punica granatum TaxID=22663 RepID=A0A6P8DB18_PUNGR|nr:RNA polymerase II C-terminal domain phosphatase-like 1 isoform X2 [Punica granatum]
MLKSVVYYGEELLGEVEVYLQQQQQQRQEGGGEDGEDYYNNNNYHDDGNYKNNTYNNGRGKMIEDVVKERIKIGHFSQPSERCPPLAVLHTITSTGVCFKMESKSMENSPLSLLHSSCIRDNKTAIMPLGKEELHLVAMFSRNNDRQYPCFWGFSVQAGLYSSCLVMLNLRCLGIVFDLDETLIVANTMRSFEDRIEALQRKISADSDPQRISGMLAEVKRYQDDKSILKQYVENDQVVDNGKVIKIQSEVVPALSDNHQTVVRPLIRMQEKNIILTRINPQIRDTSVLVRLRPAWEDLRSYLTARGRKRFEVYVCTMAERDYALEMWRLLDPESNLINPRELLDRIVCVKSGLKKSLFDVFQDGTCHPKMALVIDDRLKVWDDKDQPRVHVVPAFAPYYAPQAEANNTVPVLCVARNVACNVRGGFFKEFDDGLLQRIPEVAYEDDVKDILSPPDVSNYLVSEEDVPGSNGNKDPLAFDGMADAEVERRLKVDPIAASSVIPSAVNNIDPRLIASLQNAVASSSSPISLPTSLSAVSPLPNVQFPQAASLLKQFGHATPSEQSMQSSPAREEGEVPESELDPDTRRRLLILQHGQDVRETPPAEPFPTRPPVQVSVPRIPSRGNWFSVEEEMSPRQFSRAGPKDYALDSEMHVEKHRPHPPPPFPKIESPALPERIFHENQRQPKEALGRDERMRFGQKSSPYHSISGIVADQSQGEDIPLSQTSSGGRDFDSESGRVNPCGETPAIVLQDIAMKCGAKVEFRASLVSSMDLQFSFEAWFEGEKIGEGIGRTRREAKRQAAEGSLRHLADMYMARTKSDSASRQGDVNRRSPPNENGFFGNLNSFVNHQLPREEPTSYSPAMETSRIVNSRMEGSKSASGSVSALRELCMMEGLSLDFQLQPHLSANPVQEDEVHVEVDGQIMGRGVGFTWEEAKMQAAERALTALRSTIGQFSQKRQGSPRPYQGVPTKRLKPEYPRALQRMPSSARYPRNTPPVP